MKSALVFFVFFYLSLLLESTWCIMCSIYFLHIDPIPSLICWVALTEDIKKGVLIVILAGFLASTFSSIHFFLFPTSYLIAFLTVYFVRSNVLELSKWQAYLVTGFISVEIVVMQLAGSGSPELLWPWGLFQSGLNIAIAPLVFWLCDNVYSLLNELHTRFTHEKRA